MTGTDTQLGLVVYGRTSVRNDKSVDDQLSWRRERAAADGHRIVAEHRDDGQSASRYARKARTRWPDVVAALASGKARALAVWERSRASRDRTEWAKLMALLIGTGAMLVLNGRVHDPANPDDAFVPDLGAALAARESAMAQKRVQRGVDAIAVAGKPPGGGLYGYRSTYPDGPGRRPVRVIDDTTAPVVREIIDRVLCGETLSAIARDLNERGVPTPRKPLKGDVGRWRPAELLAADGPDAALKLGRRQTELRPPAARAGRFPTRADSADTPGMRSACRPAGRLRARSTRVGVHLG